MRKSRHTLLCPIVGIGMIAVGTAAATSADAATAACTTAAVTALALPSNVSITAATPIAAVAGTATVAGKPAFCQVTGNVNTDGEGAGPGQAAFQMDLPEFWNGKFLFLGGGGLDGNGVLADGTAQELAKGYATSSTNSGHPVGSGTFAITDIGVPNEPAIIDYFYRARHEVTVASKAIVKAFYDARKISYAYYDGCSNGGRQGLMEASRFPNDYDGIVSGAPWMDPLGTELWTVKNTRALLQAFIPPTLFPQLTAAILASCDTVDGVQDGLIQNPAKCAFNPDTLVPSVLTQAQSDAIKTILAPVTDSSGHLIYPGSSVSDLFSVQITFDENATPAPNPTAPQPWTVPPATGTTGAPGNWGLAYGIINYLGYYDPNIDLNSDYFEDNGVISDVTRILLYSRLGLDLADDPAKFAAYIGKGKKLLMYHGYSDPIISPYRTVLFYESLAGMNGGYSQLQQSVRLFMAPGVSHCGGGIGPNVFGNGAEPPGYPVDAQHDVLSALEDWVENGNAPSSIIASHYVAGAATPTVDRTMPLCPFPAEARYNGLGDVNDAASWTCTHNTALLQTGVNGREAGVDGPANQPNFPADVLR
ncbi:MAG: tannase/feruloyl esterase family alpha/beta hydrolase [Acidisphaera sp.]|nr:tannase/feruloyl esterase family alpha/beta hydrolase [Acidisphaera sp.]